MEAALLDLVMRTQAATLCVLSDGGNARASMMKGLFGNLLTSLLELTTGDFGFIGEVFHDDGTYLLTHAITNIAWNDEMKAYYENYHEEGIKFVNLNSIFGVTLRTGEAYISNDPYNDPNRCGLPPGHPTIRCYIGLPFTDANGKLIGMCGIANKKGGFVEEDIASLQPLCTTCCTMIQVMDNLRRRRQAELQLTDLNSNLEALVGERTNELKNANAELEKQIHIAKEAKKKAEEATNDAILANQSKSVFLASMSHEIRTPLNAVCAGAQLLSHSPLSQQQRHLCQIIQTNSNSLLDVVNDVLSLTKSEAHPTLELIPFSPLDLVEETLQMVSLKAETHQVLLASWFDPSLATTLIGDPCRLRQIILNLLSNALKFTPSQGCVIVRVFANREYEPANALEENEHGIPYTLRVEVSDSGIGIKKEATHLLFRPFSQMDASTTRKYGGTGLGLAICKQHAELMNGQIFFRDATPEDLLSNSKKVTGSCFVLDVVLRLARDEASATISTLVDVASLRHPTVHQYIGGALGKMISRVATSWGCEVRLCNIHHTVTKSDVITVADLRTVLLSPPGFENCGTLVLLAQPLEHMSVLQDLKRPHTHLPPHVQDIIQAAHFVLTPVKYVDLFHAFHTNDVMSSEKSEVPESDGDAVEVPVISVLITDDIEVNRVVLAMMLQRWGIAVIMTASSGTEAVRLCSEHAFDLVLMDCFMPEMDGYTATRLIREQEDGSGQHTQIVAVTAAAMPEDKQMCLDAGMDGYLTKPIVDDALLSVLRPLGVVPVGNSGIGQAPSTKTIIRQCAECTYFADVHCERCNEFLCHADFQTLHSRGRRPGHVSSRLPSAISSTRDSNSQNPSAISSTRDSNSQNSSSEDMEIKLGA